MKQILKSMILLISLSFMGCEGMDEHYKEYLEEGTIIYTGRLKDIVAHSGDGRIKLSWTKPVDPRAETVRIYWANKTDSVVMKLAEYESGIILSPMDESSYVFELYVFDKYGNTSIVDMVPGDVYGDVFRQNLLNRKILSTKKTGNQLKVTFAKFSDTRYQGSEVVYTDTDGNQVTTYFENTYIQDPEDDKKMIQVTEFMIDNYQEGSLEYKAAFLPNENALDIFYCNSEVFDIN